MLKKFRKEIIIGIIGGFAFVGLIVCLLPASDGVVCPEIAAITEFLPPGSSCHQNLGSNSDMDGNWYKFYIPHTKDEYFLVKATRITSTGKVLDVKLIPATTPAGDADPCY